VWCVKAGGRETFSIIDTQSVMKDIYLYVYACLK
jgi:hypothetical protein